VDAIGKVSGLVIAVSVIIMPKEVTKLLYYQIPKNHYWSSRKLMIDSPDSNSHIQDFYKNKLLKLEEINCFIDWDIIRDEILQENHIRKWYIVGIHKRENEWHTFQQKLKIEQKEREEKREKERKEFENECRYYDSIEWFLKWMKINVEYTGWDNTNIDIITGVLKIPCVDNVLKECTSFGYSETLKRFKLKSVIFSSFSIKKMKEKTKLIKQKERNRKIKKLLQFKKIKPNEYPQELSYWSNQIKQKFPKCFCGKKSTASHHILFRCHYPELSLNQNNGIGLCYEHHWEIHRLNPYKNFKLKKEYNSMGRILNEV